jgi:hypothetical protein
MRTLIFLLLAFFALALLFNWASPLFENSDEFFHFPLIKYLADENGSLPVQSPQDLRDWRQQGNQPPIYHLMAALLIKPLDTSDYAEVRRINPHAQIGVVGRSNINAVVHPLDRSKEFEGGTALAMRVVRVFSMLLAAVVVVCAYFMTTLTFPDLPRWVGLLAAALVAFNPMYLFVASSVNNDNMSNALISTVLVLLVWLYRQEARPSPRVMLLIGVLLGLSLLSKLSTGPFMLLVGIFWLALAVKHRALPYIVGWGVATLAIALLISGWWYLRNYDLYGDPTGLNMFLDIVGRRPIPLTAEQLWSEHEGFIQSFWGLYGGMTVPMASWAYTVFLGLCGISLVGAVVFFSGRWRRLDLPQIVVVLWPIMAGISVIRWTALTWATQGRLWFVALSCLAVLSAIGFYEIARRLRRPELAFAPVIFSLAIAVAAPFAWIRPAYAAPELTPIEDFTPNEAVAVYHDPDHPEETLQLISVELPETVLAGRSAPIQLRLCTETPLSRDWSVFVHLANEWDIILAQADFIPGQGALPTSELAGGQCWEDEYDINIPAGVVSDDTELTALVGFYDAKDMDGNNRMQLADAPLEGETRFAAATTLLAAGDELSKFVLGEKVRIAEYNLSSPTISAGEALTLSVDWEVLRPMEKDYTAFVQIIDLRTAYRAAASDKAPEGGTAAWEAGEIFTDVHTLTVAEDAPAGVYALLVGFYELTPEGGFARLRTSYEGVDTGFDTITLTQVRIE